MRNIATIKSRILEYLDYEGTSKYECYQKTGMTNGVLSKKEGLSEDNLLRFISHYSNVNLDWLLTGKGEMLHNAEKKSEKFSEKKYPPTLPSNFTPQNKEITPQLTPLKQYDPNDGQVHDFSAEPISDQKQIDTLNIYIAELQKALENKNQLLKQKDEILPHLKQVIPVYESPVSYDLHKVLSNNSKPNSYISLPNLPKCDGAIRMWGDTMAPELQSGDLLVFRKVKDLRSGLFLGQVYLLSVEFEGEEYVMVQYIEQSDVQESVRLVSRNDRYPAKDVPISSIKALAMIKASVRYRGI